MTETQVVNDVLRNSGLTVKVVGLTLWWSEPPTCKGRWRPRLRPEWSSPVQHRWRARIPSRYCRWQVPWIWI